MSKGKKEKKKGKGKGKGKGKEEEEKSKKKKKQQKKEEKKAPAKAAKPAVSAKPAPKAAKAATPAKPAPAPKAAKPAKPDKPAPAPKAIKTKGAGAAPPPPPEPAGKGKKRKGGKPLTPKDPALLAKELGRKARIAAAKAQKKAKPPEPEEEDEEEDEAEGDEELISDDDLDEEESEEEEEALEGGEGELDQREVILHDALRAQRQRDFAAAERYITRFIELFPDDLRGLIHLGNMKRARGDREAALEAFRGALRRDRDNPLALWSKADFHLSDQVSPDIGEAQDALKRIIQVCGRKKDESCQKWAEQARDKLRYCESRKFSLESRRWLKPTRDGNPPGIKSLEKARDLLAKALQVYPADPRNHMNLGSVLLQLGDAERALDCCKEAIRIHPGYARAHLILGYAHRRLGQLRQAKDAFLQCIELDRQQRDVAEAWKARREVEQELARLRRRFYNALSGRPGDEGESESLDLHRLKEWVALLEGDAVEAADLTIDPRGGYVLTAYGQRSVYKAWPGPEGLVLERQ